MEYLATVLPGGIEIHSGMHPVLAVLLITVAAWILEDPTSIGVGLLIQAGELGLITGVVGLSIALFSGDFALYMLGRVFGRRVLKWHWVADKLPAQRVDQLSDWFDRRGWGLVLMSRFVPGMRVPVYTGAGIVARRPGRFALWTLLAVCIWAPVIIASVLILGEGIWDPLVRWVGSTWLAFVLAMVVFVLTLRTAALALTSEGRRRLRVKLRRLVTFEFWPTFMVYLPLWPWMFWLWLRYRGPSTITFATPAMCHGGFLDTSKYDIQTQVSDPWGSPSVLLPAGCDPQVLDDLLSDPQFGLPLVLKPDRGDRGSSVRVAHTRERAHEVLAAATLDLVAQPWHPGPYEAGIFWMRHPDQPRGRIYSITDKVMPTVTGDGESSLEELVWRDRRLSMQWRVFFRRLQGRLDEVPEAGATVQLGQVGNHCQGAMFLDGAHLWSQALQDRLEEVLGEIEGYTYGRLDVRYECPERLRRGEGFVIIELNGAASESTNIYDPSYSAWRSWSILARQLREGWRIGYANRRRGLRGMSLWGMLKGWIKRHRPRFAVPKASD
ncbi:MAG: DedA family protein [Phycisphaerales bacterium]|nr:DedA family protein [Phycisphaerales bacterium]